MPSLNQKTLDRLPVWLPEKDLQVAIASLLSSIDKKIELNNHINAELEAMAKTLYDYWFVQFDFPDANGKPNKTSGGKMVYNPALKREMPEGWDVKKLVDLASVIRRGISPIYTEEGGIPVLEAV
ncbi:type I restriction enzyme, S subunit [Nitrosomonas halophila]|uniref:Type I restriction enzyme, S subunit n=1 Tax=Nitrosomonas halophila TaxID=44576 RepID=A0A1H3Q0Y6_9PROT|nr:type I restriction enzyme, S subunit [Nitrosomonas halophila]